MARLDIPYATRFEDIDTSNLSAELIESARAHLDGADLEATMPPSQFTRHRQGLLPVGMELGVRRVKRSPALGMTLCKQLAYASRWKPSAALLAHAVTWDTAPAILAKLDEMLATISANYTGDDAEEDAGDAGDA